MPDHMLIDDPRVRAVPVRECGEALVVWPGATATDGTPVLLRVGLLARLQRAMSRLPAGTAFLVHDGWRSVHDQQRIREAYRSTLHAAHPEWAPHRLEAETSRFAAPSDGVPPHSTGGAVDLTLATAAGTPLDLGTAVDASPHTTGGVTYLTSGRVTAAARQNRAVLAAALETEGLVNYAPEWWHWSHGDQYWAAVSGAPAARYGSVLPGPGLPSAAENPS